MYNGPTRTQKSWPVNCCYWLQKRPIISHRVVVGCGRVRWCIRSLEEFYYCDRTWCMVIFCSVTMRPLACWEFFPFSCVCGIFFLNHLTPSFKGKLRPKAPKVQLTGIWTFLFSSLAFMLLVLIWLVLF